MGTLRVCIGQGVKPSRYAFGAAAALAVMDRNTLESNVPLATWLEPLWQAASPDKHEEGKVLRLIEEGRERLQHWLASGFQNLEELFS